METIHVTGDVNQLGSLQPSPEVINEQIENSGVSSSIAKKKMKHVSALFAAAACRSAVQHAHLHTISHKPADFAHSATSICYIV